MFNYAELTNDRHTVHITDQGSLPSQQAGLKGWNNKFMNVMPVAGNTSAVCSVGIAKNIQQNKKIWWFANTR